MKKLKNCMKVLKWIITLKDKIFNLLPEYHFPNFSSEIIKFVYDKNELGR